MKRIDSFAISHLPGPQPRARLLAVAEIGTGFVISCHLNRKNEHPADFFAAGIGGSACSGSASMPVAAHRARPGAAAGLVHQRRKFRNGASKALVCASLPHIQRLSKTQRPAFRPTARKRASGMFGGSLAAALASASFVEFLAPPSVSRLFGQATVNSEAGSSGRCGHVPRKRQFCRFAVIGSKPSALCCTASAYLHSALLKSEDENRRIGNKYGFENCQQFAGIGGICSLGRRKSCLNSYIMPRSRKKGYKTNLSKLPKVVGSNSYERAGSYESDGGASSVGVIGGSAEKVQTPAEVDTASIYKSSISKDLDESHLDETLTFVFKQGVALVVRTETTADNVCQVEFSMPEQDMASLYP